MIVYRGVPQQDIVNSIINACELEQKNSPGPACDKEIDSILAAIPSLQQATDDASFQAALQKSNVHTLGRMYALFEVYANENTDGVGRQVLESLDSWGAFNGIHTMELRPMDEEVNTYRFLKCLRSIDAVDEKEVRDLIANSSYVITDDKEIKNGLKDLQTLVRKAKAGASDKELLADYEKMGIGWAPGRIARLAVEELGRNPSVRASRKSPFDRYGVVLEDMVEGARFDIVQNNNAALIERVNKFLLPFYNTGEVMMTAIGIITDNQKDPGGIVFMVTERVAQAVADAFPDQKVVRSDGGVIAPAVKKTPAVKPPKP